MVVVVPCEMFAVVKEFAEFVDPEIEIEPFGTVLERIVGVFGVRNPSASAARRRTADVRGAAGTTKAPCK